jgi:hypothetical protein
MFVEGLVDGRTGNTAEVMQSDPLIGSEELHL